jgi:hypothetical protein
MAGLFFRTCCGSLLVRFNHVHARSDYSKDYEFSRLSMAEHWRSGYSDTMCTLRHPEVLERTGNGKEFNIFDFAGDGVSIAREQAHAALVALRQPRGIARIRASVLSRLAGDFVAG